MSEAVNDSPIFVTEKAVDRDGLAVWSDGRSAEERKAYCKPPWPSLRPTAHGNDAIVIMNANSGYRIFSFTVVVVQMLLVFLLAAVPNETTAKLMTGWMIFAILKQQFCDNDEQQYDRRCREWNRRYFEALRGGHHGTFLQIGGEDVNFSSSGGSAHLLNNAPLPHDAFPTGIEGKLVPAKPSTGAGKKPLRNAAELEGNWALMDRGVVSFSQKVRKAMEAGAVGVVLANDDTKMPDAMIDLASQGSDTGDDLTIPLMAVSFNEGRRLKKLYIQKGREDPEHHGVALKLIVDDKKHQKGKHKAGEDGSLLDRLRGKKLHKSDSADIELTMMDLGLPEDADERRAQLRSNFDNIDSDGSGFIDPEELKRALTRTTTKAGAVDEATIQGWLADTDTNDDGARPPFALFHSSPGLTTNVLFRARGVQARSVSTNLWRCTRRCTRK